METQGGEGLRKRQVSNSSTAPPLIEDATLKRDAAKRNKPALSALQLVTIVLHIAALMTVVFGFYIRAGFHNGDECDMTYSMLNYVPIHMEEQADTATTSYNLYKFVDSRDPRHEPLLNKAKHPIEGSAHCVETNPFVVLYIPGHWGEYSQCRSIGAHGDQMTRRGHTREYVSNARQLLQDGIWNGHAELEENFVFEMYCLDFAEQGSALHGNLIRTQSQYVAKVVKKLLVRVYVCIPVNTRTASFERHTSDKACLSHLHGLLLSRHT